MNSVNINSFHFEQRLSVLYLFENFPGEKPDIYLLPVVTKEIQNRVLIFLISVPFTEDKDNLKFKLLWSCRGV